MRWKRLAICAGLLLAAWAALAAWQYHEYDHERQAAEQSLQRQADSVMNALVGGIRSHRRLGRFFPEQLKGALDQLVAAEDILAAGVVADDGRLVLTAGKAELLDTSRPIASGAFWDESGFLYVADFQLTPETDAGPGGPGGGEGGRGGGRGWGRGWRWQAEAGQPSPFVTGGQFYAMLLLDRTHADALIDRAFWLRIWVAAAGGLVLFCIAIAWWTTVRWVEAHGRTRLLEGEARHLRELSQAAAGLAHETRNPLGLIRGWTQRLADSCPHASEQQQQARGVIEECDRLTSRINQFLAFAKPREPVLTVVDPCTLIDGLAALVEPDLDAKGLKLESTVGKRPWTIRADCEMLRQALFNLIRNAIQFSPEQGAEEVAVRPAENGCCRIEVADRGPGVPADKVASLFTPYYTTRPDGAGLGLAIVRRIATAHGWEAGYTPRAGGGSVFWLDRIHG